MTLPSKNSGYACLVRLDIMFSLWIWREFHLLQILKDLPMKRLIKLIFYGNDIKLINLRRRLTLADSWYIWSLRFWLLIPEINTSRNATEWLSCVSIVNLMLGRLLFKKSEKFNKCGSLSKTARMPSRYFKYNLDLLRLSIFSHLDL